MVKEARENIKSLGYSRLDIKAEQYDWWYEDCFYSYFKVDLESHSTQKIKQLSLVIGELLLVKMDRETACLGLAYGNLYWTDYVLQLKMPSVPERIAQL